MEYNTARNKMVLPEYGRNIQKMVAHALTIEDKDERNKAAKAIVDVMGQLNPHLRDVTDFKHKLWDHLFIISDFKLDVDSPYPIPTAETLVAKPQKLRYPSNHIKYRHYGKNIEIMIEKAKQMPEGEAKQHTVLMIANFMKMAYVNYNQDSVMDELILKDLKVISQNELHLSEGAILAQNNDLINKSIKKKENNKNGRKQIGKPGGKNRNKK